MSPPDGLLQPALGFLRRRHAAVSDHGLGKVDGGSRVDGMDVVRFPRVPDSKCTKCPKGLRL
jgi:hypothetical protein